MNGLRRDGLDRARTLAERARAADPGAEIVIFPPATLLAEIRAALDGSPILLGAQDCAPEEKGAFTGDLAAPMLADAGCRYVIVGHSERRHGHGESDALVRAKALAARRAGLVPIVCAGETEGDRAAGRALEVVEGQLAASLPEDGEGSDCVLAYEPVWAIGTGRTAGAAEVGEMHGALRAALRSRLGATGAGLRLLYGGSVTPENAARFLAVPEVDGLLVGGASLDPDGFWAICQSAGEGPRRPGSGG